MNFPWDELNVIRSKIERLEIEATAEPVRRRSDGGGIYPVYAMSPGYRAGGSRTTETTTTTGIEYRTEFGSEPGTEQPKKKYDAEKCIDIIYEYLEEAWAMGVENTNENLRTSYAPESPSMEPKMRAEIDRKIAGKNYKERVREWAEKGDLDAIMRVAETDAHRVLNSAAMTTAKMAGAKYKIWVCVFRNSRDTHMDLHDQRVGIDDYFVTYNDHRTQYPGEFGIAEEDCNCQCYLNFA